MARVPVFYSFHYGNDVMRVQLVRNMGVIEGNEPVSSNEWEAVKRNGSAAIERWIDENMKHRRCVVVLIGEETASRTWVQYEIKKAWQDGKGLFGVYIHNLKDVRTGTCRKGANPFRLLSVGGTPLSDIVNCYEPNPANAYGDIAANMQTWVDRAIAQRKAA